ncbi:MAG: hypothetical protein EXQ85_05010 [Alphaproteobacteria bacterium]|nr:hypothetical protein [Alphaproteobacteria bacterium]
MSRSHEAASERAAAALFEQRGEAAYTAMYEVVGATAAAGCYSDAKLFFAQAIGAAERGGDADDARRLRVRLDHIINVFRHQFS